jgi:hypothetical protein
LRRTAGDGKWSGPGQSGGPPVWSGPFTRTAPSRLSDRHGRPWRGHRWGKRDGQHRGGWRHGPASRKADRPDRGSHGRLPRTARTILRSRGPGVRRFGNTQSAGTRRSDRPNWVVQCSWTSQAVQEAGTTLGISVPKRRPHKVMTKACLMKCLGQHVEGSDSRSTTVMDTQCRPEQGDALGRPSSACHPHPH